MRAIDIFAILLTLSALFSWFNQRYLKLPETIGLMLIALLVSLVLLMLEPAAPALELQAREMLERIHFDDTLLHGMLALLLFAGALHVNLDELARQRWVIAILASVSVIAATFLVGISAWGLFALLGLGIPLIHCLIFGALIAPTDPIAILGIMKNAAAPQSVSAIITGESLLNDGVAVAAFVLFSGIATRGHLFGIREMLAILTREVVGGVAFGLLIGWLTYQLLRRIDDYKSSVLITLALATGVYALADRLHLSAPIAVVVAGLMVANYRRGVGLPGHSREHLDTFWQLVDEVLNAVLFVVIGLEVLVLSFTEKYLVAGLMTIPLVLLARLISIGLPLASLRRFRSFAPGVVSLLTWAGLRGGVSVALALSLPPGETRDALVAVTYVIVVFSIVAQGLTLPAVIRATAARAETELKLGERAPS
jgi:CPA1 family monovalent cation:H+ antiporter